MRIESEKFPSTGFLNLEFSDDEIYPIKKEIEYIKNNESSSDKANEFLAGHLKKEYQLKKCKDYVESLIIPVAKKYIEEFGFPSYANSVLTDDRPLILDKIWVNFQQKYEFNPIHHHSGIFSFVIWIVNPYDEDEKNFFNNINLTEISNGNFAFIYTDNFGMISYKKVFTDKSFENKGLLFPSMLRHCVYPFYTSNEYRISVSGNLKLKV